MIITIDVTDKNNKYIITSKNEDMTVDIFYENEYYSGKILNISTTGKYLIDLAERGKNV